MLEIYTRKKEAKNFASFRGPDGPIQQVRAFSSRPTDTLLKPVASSPSQSAYAEFRAKKKKTITTSFDGYNNMYISCVKYAIPCLAIYCKIWPNVFIPLTRRFLFFFSSPFAFALKRKSYSQNRHKQSMLRMLPLSQPPSLHLLLFCFLQYH